MRKQMTVRWEVRLGRFYISRQTKAFAFRKRRYAPASLIVKAPFQSSLLLCAVLLRFSSTAADTSAIATIPFSVTRGHVMVPVRVNDSEPLSFMLDTGYSITMIHPELTGPLKLERV